MIKVEVLSNWLGFFGISNCIRAAKHRPAVLLRCVSPLFSSWKHPINDPKSSTPLSLWATQQSHGHCCGFW